MNLTRDDMSELEYLKAVFDEMGVKYTIVPWTTPPGADETTVGKLLAGAKSGNLVDMSGVMWFFDQSGRFVGSRVDEYSALVGKSR